MLWFDPIVSLRCWAQCLVLAFVSQPQLVSACLREFHHAIKWLFFLETSFSHPYKFLVCASIFVVFEISPACAVLSLSETITSGKDLRQRKVCARVSRSILVELPECKALGGLLSSRSVLSGHLCRSVSRCAIGSGFSILRQETLVFLRAWTSLFWFIFQLPADTEFDHVSIWFSAQVPTLYMCDFTPLARDQSLLIMMIHTSLLDRWSGYIISVFGKLWSLRHTWLPSYHRSHLWLPVFLWALCDDGLRNHVLGGYRSFMLTVSLAGRIRLLWAITWGTSHSSYLLLRSLCALLLSLLLTGAWVVNTASKKLSRLIFPRRVLNFVKHLLARSILLPWASTAPGSLARYRSRGLLRRVCNISVHLSLITEMNLIDHLSFLIWPCLWRLFAFCFYFRAQFWLHSSPFGLFRVFTIAQYHVFSSQCLKLFFRFRSPTCPCSQHTWVNVRRSRAFDGCWCLI